MTWLLKRVQAVCIGSGGYGVYSALQVDIVSILSSSSGVVSAFNTLRARKSVMASLPIILTV